MTAEDFPYAECRDCDEKFADKAAMIAHLRATFGVGHSHTARVVNPTAEEKVQRLVDATVDEAITRCLDDLYREIRGGQLTLDDATKCLRHYPDFADAWTEYMEESAR